MAASHNSQSSGHGRLSQECQTLEKPWVSLKHWKNHWKNHCFPEIILNPVNIWG
jgi:hypothetical protein